MNEREWEVVGLRVGGREVGPWAATANGRKGWECKNTKNGNRAKECTVSGLKRVESHAPSVKNGLGVRANSASKDACFSENKRSSASPIENGKARKVYWRLVIP